MWPWPVAGRLPQKDRARVTVTKQRVRYRIGRGIRIFRAEGAWHSRNRAVRSPTADDDRAVPGAEERLFRDDLSRVRDEPEQGLGLWIGMTVKTGAGNSPDDTGRVPRATGNAQGERGNTPDDGGNVQSAISHSRGA